MQDRVARRAVPFSHGTVVLNEDLPRVYDTNFARVERDFDALSAGMLATEVEEIQAACGLAHRKIVMPDEAAGERVLPGLRRLGYASRRLVVMAYEGPREPPAPAGDAPAVSAVSMEELRPLHDRTSTEFLPPASRDAVPQLARFFERLVAAADTTLLTAALDGEAAAYCALFRGGGVAQIDQVSTLERARRRGLGGAVVGAGLARALAAGDELVFLVAHESDWPRRWYARLGFRAIAVRHEFTRT